MHQGLPAGYVVVWLQSRRLATTCWWPLPGTPGWQARHCQATRPHTKATPALLPLPLLLLPLPAPAAACYVQGMGVTGCGQVPAVPKAPGHTPGITSCHMLQASSKSPQAHGKAHHSVQDCPMTTDGKVRTNDLASKTHHALNLNCCSNVIALLFPTSLAICIACSTSSPHLPHASNTSSSNYC